MAKLMEAEHDRYGIWVHKTRGIRRIWNTVCRRLEKEQERKTQRFSRQTGHKEVIPWSWKEKNRQHSHATKAGVPLLHDKEKKGFLRKQRISQMQSTTLGVLKLEFLDGQIIPDRKEHRYHLSLKRRKISRKGQVPLWRGGACVKYVYSRKVC